jgi:hypothetical protein
MDQARSANPRPTRSLARIPQPGKAAWKGLPQGLGVPREVLKIFR